MEAIGIGFICIGGLIVFNNVNNAYNYLNPNQNPKTYKVQKYTTIDEFDSQYNQLYNVPDVHYILVEEKNDKKNFIQQKIGKIMKNYK